jgi:hypothetical protein
MPALAAATRAAVEIQVVVEMAVAEEIRNWRRIVGGQDTILRLRQLWRVGAEFGLPINLGIDYSISKTHAISPFTPAPLRGEGEFSAVG